MIANYALPEMHDDAGKVRDVQVALRELADSMDTMITEIEGRES
jgi:hypothetical protein